MLPDGPRSQTILKIYLVTVAGIAIWLGAIAAAPFFLSRAIPLAPFFYACFSLVCHQNPERSFFVFGHPLAVCARCLGVYAGFLAGTAAYPFRRGFSSVRLPPRRVLIIGTTPIVLDTAANVFRLWNTGNVLRFAIGFAWGSILPFYFITGLAEAFGRHAGQFNR
jgi:uncharacterized membrane protein